jgi:hypothetical protein
LESPPKVTYDLTRLKPVMKYSMPLQYREKQSHDVAPPPDIEPSLATGKLSKIVASFRTRPSIGEPVGSSPTAASLSSRKVSSEDRGGQGTVADADAVTASPAPAVGLLKSVLRSLSPSKRQVSFGSMNDANGVETPSKGLVGKLKSALSLTKRSLRTAVDDH